jgi:hypothetical protein
MHAAADLIYAAKSVGIYSDTQIDVWQQVECAQLVE